MLFVLLVLHAVAGIRLPVKDAYAACSALSRGGCHIRQVSPAYHGNMPAFRLSSVTPRLMVDPHNLQDSRQDAIDSRNRLQSVAGLESLEVENLLELSGGPEQEPTDGHMVASPTAA